LRINSGGAAHDKRQEYETVKAEQTDQAISPLRDRCTIFKNCERADEHPLQRSYRDLRSERVVEYGWIDLREGSRDHDAYDEVGVRTLSVLLHTTDGRLKSGARVTVADGASIAESLSASMWPEEQRQVLAGHSSIAEYFAAGDLVDCTRLLLGDGSGPADAIELIGACVAATGGLMGTYMSVQKIFVDFFAACGIPVEIIHEQELDGVPSAFIMIRPPEELNVDNLRTRQSLSRGALLVDPLAAPGYSFYSAPDIDIRDHVIADRYENVVTMAKLIQR
jgi:hypothetical protein